MLIPLSVLVYCGAGGIKVGCLISVALLLCSVHILHCVAVHAVHCSCPLDCSFGTGYEVI